jgi:tRNA (guanine37-N1)-methyltransferase
LTALLVHVILIFIQVDNFVRPFCEDGHTFIKSTADNLLALAASGQNTVTIPSKVRRSRTNPDSTPVPAPEVITIPKTISHFVMNLPATAIAFLPSFSGLYTTQEQLFEPHTQTKLPMVHVHCFSTKSDDNVKEGLEIAERVSKELGVEMRVGKEEEMGLEGVVYVREVRDVAPKKRMFCASFRVPKEVAFRSR